MECFTEKESLFTDQELNIRVFSKTIKSKVLDVIPWSIGRDISVIG